MALPIIEVPKYELTLPSTKKKIEFRPYLVKEEKILILALESKDNNQIVRALRDVISACTYEKININDMALFDLEYVFLKLRSVSVGSVSVFKAKCEKCEAYTAVDINLDEVNVAGDMNANASIQLNETVGITMKYPTVKAAIQNGSVTEDSYDAIIATVVSCIDSIYDADNIYEASKSTTEELVTFLESLNQEQFSKINEFLGNMPGLEHHLEYTCEKCNSENTMLLRGINSFF